ncbi:NADP-dependent 3-hydroxy acid dehydrogenase YdfG [Pedobacter steynii]|uniref:NADP-dependent 3-hydroxy acid dehydrogenase YdfG n=1 Tax=Pedobacter steynii TaxID=430522 RepID=A0A1G9PTT9_9SPHI|nr:SDR family NAD(P)-dependent oxidoreductase [Pedobacter steynii]NQX38880.1 SDR family NAD(P)-dependent oxidoreductase [Pedobacter steynii]SDM02176.1 NADP-dependent 3-hydroxy acid dehydrogenase YdfG [Pedobacter steynii]
MDNQKVWFVTGASKGLGLSLVKQLLKEGFKVAATSRKINELTDAVGVDDPNFLPLVLDLQNEDSVAAAIATGIDRFGKIDVVVNNAGYGLTGSLEELSDEEARANFAVNVFGSLNVIRKVMPHFRAQHSGHIFNIASIGGYTGGFPGFGIYCATKFAVAGFSESLAAEVKPFGVHVTVVYPGYFRTNFLSQGSLLTPKNEISAYQEVREVQNAHQHSIDGNQAGDPEKAVAALINMTAEEQPPLHLFLGADAYELAYGKIAQVQQALEQFKAITVNTGF